MRKKLALVLLFIASIFSFSSCDLEMHGTYNFSHTVNYSVEKEDTKKALETYFKSKINFDDVKTMTGSRSEALTFGVNILEETAKVFSKEEILALIGTKDVVIYSLQMTGEKTNVTVGGIIWSHEEQDSEDSTENY